MPISILVNGVERVQDTDGPQCTIDSVLDGPHTGRLYLSGDAPADLATVIIKGWSIGDMPALLTWTNDGYDILQTRGSTILSAIEGTGGSKAHSNDWGVTAGVRYTVTLTLTLNSGEAPALYWNDTDFIQDLEEGENLITFASAAGKEYLTLRSANPSDYSLTATLTKRLFGGHLLSHDFKYVGDANADAPMWDCALVDFSFRLGLTRKINAEYTSIDAGDLVLALIALVSPPGITTTNVQTGLGTIDAITFTNEDLRDALDRIKVLVGARWYVDYESDLHVFVGDEGLAAPAEITLTDPSAVGLSKHHDDSQRATRVYYEGGGSNVAAAIDIGETIVPVEDGSWYSTGQVAVARQRLSYGSVDAGGFGTLVGPGVTPSSGPGVAAQAGSGIDDGDHYWGYTWITAAGETRPSPLSALLALGSVAAPPAAPYNTYVQAGTGPNDGVHLYAVTFAVGAGETTASPTLSVTTFTVAAPSSGGVPNYTSGLGYGTSVYDVGDSLTFKITYVNVDGGETTVGPVSSALTATTRPNSGGLAAEPYLSSLPSPVVGSPESYAIASKRAYLYVNGVYSGYRSEIPNKYSSTHDVAIYGLAAASAPSGNTAYARKVYLQGIPTGPTGTTARKVYRTVAGGSQLKLLATISNNTATTYTDQTSDAGLGANVPTSNTTAVNQCVLSAIALGPTGTTARKVYRTVAGGSQLKLLATIGDNATTTYADSTADASLGANAPTGDTSGLTSPDGQVNQGATSLLLASASGFNAGGGWALLPGGQMVRYTGISGNTLTGIPSSGVGAIAATIKYNQTVMAMPALLGVPASGDGSIVYAILQGEAADIVAQVDDTTAQADLVALVDPDGSFGFDGVIEDYQRDNRLSLIEATARAQARLELVSPAVETVSYETDDTLTRVGATVPVDVGDFSGDFLIQSVHLEIVGAFPIYRVEASSRRFSLEALLRQIKAPA